MGGKRALDRAGMLRLLLMEVMVVVVVLLRGFPHRSVAVPYGLATVLCQRFELLESTLIFVRGDVELHFETKPEFQLCLSKLDKRKTRYLSPCLV